MRGLHSLWQSGRPVALCCQERLSWRVQGSASSFVNGAGRTLLQRVDGRTCLDTVHRLGIVYRLSCILVIHLSSVSHPPHPYPSVTTQQFQRTQLTSQQACTVLSLTPSEYRGHPRGVPRGQPGAAPRGLPVAQGLCPPLPPNKHLMQGRALLARRVGRPLDIPKQALLPFSRACCGLLVLPPAECQRKRLL